ncbi:MAG TPA: hypothetical protein VGG33_00340 [Polyangia bacterium]
MRQLRSPCLPALAFTIALGASACDEHAKPSIDVNEYFYDCENPARPASLTRFATDESLIALLNKESARAVRTVDENAATLSMPTPGSTISAVTPPTFVIQPPVTSARERGLPRTDALATPSGPRPRPARSLWEKARAWLSPIGTAHAHCLPVTGDNYLIRLTREGDASPAYSTLVSVPSFSPTPAVWAKAMQGRAGQTLKVTIIRAFYSGGTITDGPFIGTQVPTLVVGP